MHVLIGMEQFGHTREAYRRRGHQAWSCDLFPARDGSPYHIQDDVRRHLRRAPDGCPWDLAIFHPDCTYFTNSAAWAFNDPDYERYPGVGYHQKVKPGTLVGQARRDARERDADLVRELRDSKIPRKAFENPTGYMSTILGKASQTIHPNQFGHDASKATCLWLFNVPLLVPTKLIAPRMVNGLPRWGNQTDSGQNNLPPSADRAMLRAATYPGISDAFAEQWGYHLDGIRTAMDLFREGAGMRYLIPGPDGDCTRPGCMIADGGCRCDGPVPIAEILRLANDASDPATFSPTVSDLRIVEAALLAMASQLSSQEHQT